MRRLCLSFALLTASCAAATPGTTAITSGPVAGTGASAGRDVQLFMIAGEGPMPAGAVRIGCDDYLVPIAGHVTGATAEAQLEGALARLVREKGSAAYSSALAAHALPMKVSRSSDGTLVVDFTGKPIFAGTCGVPRLTEQVERTARQFGAVEIRLNGSAREWRCLGDESGRCN